MAASEGLASKCRSKMLWSRQLFSFEPLEMNMLLGYIDVTSYLSRYRPISYLQHVIGYEQNDSDGMSTRTKAHNLAFVLYPMRKLTRYLFLLLWRYHTLEQTVSKCYLCICRFMIAVEESGKI